MVDGHIYCWTVRPGNEDIAVELRVTAPSVSAARRQVHRFLIEHRGETWTVEAVSREVTATPLPLLRLPARGPGRPGS